MRSLLFRYSYKHHRAHLLRLLMVMLSLALGVAIFVSSYESIVAAEDSITTGAQALGGKAQWRVSRGRYLGVEEGLVAKFRQIPGAIVAPIIESTVSTSPPKSQTFLLIGLDLNSDAMSRLYGANIGEDSLVLLKLSLGMGGMVVSEPFARKHTISEGAIVRFQTRNGTRSVEVVGVAHSQKLSLVAGGNIGFMELHAAQAFLGSKGMVDRIEVAGTSKSALERACPECQVVSANKLSSAAGDALGRIHSLLGVSVIALLVGVLLIFNSVQVSVLERIKDIAVIRSIGATRIQVFGCLLTEWFIIGSIGSSAGLLMGVALAYALVEYTKKTINTMLPLMGDAHVQATPALVITGLVVGIGTTMIAAFFPIWTAANVRPLEILRPYTFRRTHHYSLAACVGVILCIAGNIAIAKVSVSMVAGLVVTGVVFLGVALVFPQVVLVLASVCRPLLIRLKRAEPFLALDGLVKTPHRTAFTIMTFGCALAMTVATETLVEGFRVSTGQWMNSAFPFDLSVMGNDLASSVYGNQVLPVSLIPEIRRIRGTGRVYGVRKLLTPIKGEDAMVIGVDTADYVLARKEKRLSDWPPNFNEPAVKHEFMSGTGTFVSSNFERIYDIHPGDTVKIQTPTGGLKLKILGAVDDYSWPHGAFIMDRSALRNRWKDNFLSYIDVSVTPGTPLDEVKSSILSNSGKDRSVYVYDRVEIRQVTDAVLEQAVQMANLQAAIAVLIGLLGIVNAIWIGVISRKAEIALWRAIGVTRRQVGLIILFEGFFVSIVAALVGTFGGLYGGWVPLRAFSFDVTGYVYPMVVPWAHVAFVSALSLVLGLAAGLLPALHAAKLPILESIGYE